MSADTWTLHIVETFLNVLRRPKLGLKISELQETKPKIGQESLFVTIEGFGETVLLSIRWNAKSINFQAFPSEDPFAGLQNSGFKFKIVFPRNKPPKVRKSALLFAEKFRNKPVYDVMKS
jgi:hypothetical protein